MNEISILMHKAGGIVAFDYATAAPYVKVLVNTIDYSALSDLYHYILYIT